MIYTFEVRPNAFKCTCSASPTSASDKSHGIRVGEVLHPVSIGIKDLLSRPMLDNKMEIFILRSNFCENKE